jgi:hypothetical protein
VVAKASYTPYCGAPSPTQHCREPIFVPVKPKPKPDAPVSASVEAHLSSLREGRFRESKLTAGEIAELATQLLAQLRSVEPEDPEVPGEG